MQLGLSEDMKLCMVYAKEITFSQHLRIVKSVYFVVICVRSPFSPFVFMVVTTSDSLHSKQHFLPYIRVNMAIFHHQTHAAHKYCLCILTGVKVRF